ncbi:hypothetical protein [Bradyrhizobium sp. 27S5]|uniref:hypothetical protein n=1 Tax=Bradyrhizobium sp. 27S5 TaxID=3139728 RepID=UPI0030D0C884
MSTEIDRIISGVVGGSVSIAAVRDPSDGTLRFAVTYKSRGIFWMSRARFPESHMAEAAAIALGEWLSAKVVL